MYLYPNVEEVEDSPNHEHGAKLRGAGRRKGRMPLAWGLETQSPLAPRTRRSPSKMHRLRRDSACSVKLLNDGEASSNL